MPSVLTLLGYQSPLTISALAQLSQGDQNRKLGKRLLPLAQEMCPAQELTAMLFGVDNSEAIHLLESESLRATMNEYDDCCTTTRHEAG